VVAIFVRTLQDSTSFHPSLKSTCSDPKERNGLVCSKMPMVASYIFEHERREPSSEIFFFGPHHISSGESIWRISDCLYWAHTSPSTRERRHALFLGLYSSPEAKRSGISRIAYSASIQFSAPGVEGFCSCPDHIDLRKRNGLIGCGLPIVPPHVFGHSRTRSPSPDWTVCTSNTEVV
jgi:hypothetical protein